MSILPVVKELVAAGQMAKAASVIDVGWDGSPGPVADLRAELLDSLAVEAFNLRFRYIPARRFRMGSESGDPDEQPIHEVSLPACWMADTPIHWAAVAAIMGLPVDDPWSWDIWRDEGLPFSYDTTLKCTHYSQDPNGWDQKPVVVVVPAFAEALFSKMSDDQVTYRLPTEAEWEMAARGGLVGKRYPWGDEPPDNRADLAHIDDPHLKPSRWYPANGYGLYAMSGGVWEICADGYDGLAYSNTPHEAPVVAMSEGTHHVIRGGSWVDHPAAATVSFRSHFPTFSDGSPMESPTIGLRICREEK